MKRSLPVGPVLAESRIPSRDRPEPEPPPLKGNEFQRLEQVAARLRSNGGCHHAKEEHPLFPAMEGKEFGRDTGPLCVMLCEHTVAREAVRGMKQEIGKVAKGGARAVGRFVSHARRCFNLLRQHIEKEDHFLFAVADQAFSDAEQAEPLAPFGLAKRAGIGQAAKEKVLESARRLAECYPVDAAVPPLAGTRSCGAQPCGVP